ncbi:MAG: glutathione S-transferase family protein [Pseudomonadota bacterium]
MKLHWSPDSANLVVRMALHGFEMDYEGVRLNRAEADHKSPGYLRLNPRGLIPVLEDGDVVLFETGAILLHLAEKAGRFGPSGPETEERAARAAFTRWLFFLSNTIHGEMLMGFYTPRYTDEAGIPAVQAAVARRLTEHLSLIEANLPVQGGLAGPAGLLEIYLGCLIRWSQLYGAKAHRLPGLEPWPRLHLLMSNLEDRIFVRDAAAAERIPPQPFTRPKRPDVPRSEITG